MIKSKCEKLHKVFYTGDQLTDLEIDIERMYVGAKHDKVDQYAKRKSIRSKVKWTVSDMNRH